MAKLSDVVAAINEMNAAYPRPGMGPLELSEAFNVRTEFASSYPGAANAGVYVFLSADDVVLYVGKASVGLGARLGAHFRYSDSDRNAGYATDPEFRNAGIAVIRTIRVDPGHEFEAGAIESFLIGRLQPPLNKQGTAGK